VLANRRILVTGAGGFIGRHVVRLLSNSGAQVRALVGVREEYPDFKVDGVEASWGDIEERPLLRQLTRDINCVVHLAGPPSVSRSFAMADEFHRVHVGGTAALLATSHAAGAARFVYVSSAEVYGQPSNNPVAEGAPLRPRSPYGVAKAEAEQRVASHARAVLMEALILRPFSVYGPGAAHTSLVHTLVDQARSGRPIRLADLRPVRDYCYVQDVADAIVRACSVGGIGCDTFNVGTGRGTSVRELGELVLRALDASAPIDEEPGRRRPDSVEILELVADVSHSSEALKWTARTPLEVGLRKWLKP